MTTAPNLQALNLQPQAEDRLRDFLSKDWSLPGNHPLSRLHNVTLGPYRLILLLGPRNHVGSQYFQLFLAGPEGTLAAEPLALGLYNRGPYPGFNWVELIRFNSRLSLDGTDVDLRTDGLDLQLMRMLSELVPPGGHLMVEYDSPSQEETAQALTANVPPAASEIGYLLFQVGCRSFRDWYIPEGGREGPRKLQGFKPYNDDIAREKTEALKKELESFISRSGDASADKVQAGGLERAKRAYSGL